MALALQLHIWPSMQSTGRPHSERAVLKPTPYGSIDRTVLSAVIWNWRRRADVGESIVSGRDPHLGSVARTPKPVESTKVNNVTSFPTSPSVSMSRKRGCRRGLDLFCRRLSSANSTRSGDSDRSTLPSMRGASTSSRRPASRILRLAIRCYRCTTESPHSWTTRVLASTETGRTGAMTHVRVRPEGLSGEIA